MVSSSITNEDIFKLMKTEIEQLNKNVSQIKIEIEKVNLKYKDIAEENITLKNKLQNLEQKLKKYNIVIYGVTETEETAVSQTVNFINNQLKVKVGEEKIRDAYRIGRKQEGQLKVRPLVVEFLNYSTKQSVIISAKKLPRGCGFYITNDYTQEEYNKRKVLYTHLRKAREAHNSAYIKNNILYVNGGQYSYDDLENDTTEENDAIFGENQEGDQHKEISHNIHSLPKNTFETKKREERISEDQRYSKTKGSTQKGSSTISSLLRNTPPRLRSNSSSAKV
nr:unnamed protein product [Callosobruchus analis]CAI5830314.1 unnamed protein product [Callosobruchus analis]CAI5856516.1 unnamed protein product [Callosobruchus analis]